MVLTLGTTLNVAIDRVEPLRISGNVVAIVAAVLILFSLAKAYIVQEYEEYEWMELSIIGAQDCLPTSDAGCSAMGVDRGAISVTVTRKCHQVIFEDETFELVDSAGNRYAMHATDTDTPDVNAPIPAGWTLEGNAG